MALSKLPYKGTRDFFPPQMRQRDFLFQKMREIAELHSYEPYDGPLLEEVDLYLAKSGEELINEQIYSFIDRGERKVAIRPEMTPTVARMVAQIHKEQSKPLRWYAIPNLMRYEKPQKGRLREHWQFNCDIFGAPEGLGEIEILQVASGLLKSFGATEEHFEILINDRRIVDAIFNNLLKLSAEQSHKLYKIIDKSKKVSPEALDKMISEIISNDLTKNHFKEYLKLDSVASVISFLERHALKDSAAGFIAFSDRLQSSGLSKFVIYDPTIVRGLDYYTGIVFEIFDKSPDNRRAICGGGAYANLLQIFNEDPLPGVGFGLGDVTLADFLKTHGLLKEFEKPDIGVLVAYLDASSEAVAMELSRKLRSLGLNTELYLGEAKPKKIFSHTDKRGHKGVIMIGSNEVQTGEVEIKRLTDQEKARLKIESPELIKKFLE
ncbi:MAG: histidine--tRNA ligase [Bacteriovoracaceae bacterium]|nr:histidine--tRNA ligase [Bacteriovoracaceae bacterium]